MSFRSDLFEALAKEFPDAAIRYERDRFAAGGGSTFTIVQFIYERKRRLSIGFHVSDVEAEACRVPDALIELKVNYARLAWGKQLVRAAVA